MNINVIDIKILLWLNASLVLQTSPQYFKIQLLRIARYFSISPKRSPSHSSLVTEVLAIWKTFLAWVIIANKFYKSYRYKSTCIHFYNVFESNRFKANCHTNLHTSYYFLTATRAKWNSMSLTDSETTDSTQSCFWFYLTI